MRTFVAISRENFVIRWYEKDHRFPLIFIEIYFKSEVTVIFDISILTQDTSMKLVSQKLKQRTFIYVFYENHIKAYIVVVKITNLVILILRN